MHLVFHRFFEGSVSNFYDELLCTSNRMEAISHKKMERSPSTLQDKIEDHFRRLEIKTAWKKMQLMRIEEMSTEASQSKAVKEAIQTRIDFFVQRVGGFWSSPIKTTFAQR